MALLTAFILIYYSGFARYFVGGDDIWLYMSAPGGWDRVIELFADIGGTYRPIPFSFFSLYHVFDHNIAAMHWVPIILHTVNVLLVYRLSHQLSKSRLGAVIGAILYGVSPIIFFDVFTLTGLVDQVFLLFGLSSIWMMARGNVGYSWLLFILAMFSKESFVSVLLVLSYFLWQKRGNWKQWLLYWGPTLIYFGFKLALYRQQGGAYTYTLSLDTLQHNLFDYGLWLINWRHGWQMGMPYEPHRYYDVVSLLYGSGIILATWQAWQNKRSLFWLAWWWGVAGLVPFYFLGRALPFYLAFSLVGLAIIVAAGMKKMQRKWLYAVIMGGLAIYMSYITRIQWLEYSFSARGVQAAEQFRDEVITRHNWNNYDTLCLTGVGEYELWATGAGEEVNMNRDKRIKVYINEAAKSGSCDSMQSVIIEYFQGHYR